MDDWLKLAGLGVAFVAALASANAFVSRHTRRLARIKQEADLLPLLEGETQTRLRAHLNASVDRYLSEQRRPLTFLERTYVGGIALGLAVSVVGFGGAVVAPTLELWHWMANGVAVIALVVVVIGVGFTWKEYRLTGALKAPRRPSNDNQRDSAQGGSEG